LEDVDLADVACSEDGRSSALRRWQVRPRSSPVGSAVAAIAARTAGTAARTIVLR
jgi:hypothetical protein